MEPTYGTYEVTLTDHAVVRRTYRVTARSKEEAIAHARKGEHRCIEEEVYGEEERDSEAVLLEGPP
jgi:hypothetical protein